MLQAMNTGHDGSICTVHSNTPRDALTRIENLVMMGTASLPPRAVRIQIASAVDLIVQIQRMRDGGRRITHVSEIVGMEGEVVTMNDVFLFEYAGRRRARPHPRPLGRQRHPPVLRRPAGLFRPAARLDGGDRGGMTGSGSEQPPGASSSSCSSSPASCRRSWWCAATPTPGGSRAGSGRSTKSRSGRRAPPPRAAAAEHPPDRRAARPSSARSRSSGDPATSRRNAASPGRSSRRPASARRRCGRYVGAKVVGAAVAPALAAAAAAFFVRFAVPLGGQPLPEAAVPAAPRRDGPDHARHPRRPAHGRGAGERRAGAVLAEPRGVRPGGQQHRHRAAASTRRSSASPSGRG